MAYGAILGQKMVQTASGGKRYANVVVGTSTSGWTANDCDYLCDGTNDNVEIQAAINACNGTGTVLILSGTYNISSTVTRNGSGNDFRIMGTGGTILKRQTATGSSTVKCFLQFSGTCVENLIIDGNSSIMSGSNVCDLAISQRGIVRNCEFQNSFNYGMVANSGNITEGITIENCSFSNKGILTDGSQCLRIVKNYTEGSELLNCISTSTTLNNAVISDNIVEIPESGGITISSCSGVIISNNICSKIEIKGSYNIVSNNRFLISTSTPRIILNTGSTYNTVTGNILRYFGSTGSIQDNGSNNVKANNISS